MTELQPKCNPEGIYCVKRACAELGVSFKTFRRYREMGLIAPVNPQNRVLGAAHFAVYKVLEVADKLLVALGYLHEVDVCIHIGGD